MNIQDFMKLVETYASEKSSEDRDGDYGPLCPSHATRDALQSALDAQATKIDQLQAGYLKIRVALGLDLHSTDNLLEVIERLRSCLSVRVVHQLQKERDAMREALERIADKRNTHFAGDAQVLASSALAAANAVSHQKPEPTAAPLGTGITSGTNLAELREKIHDEHRTGLDG